MGAKKNVNNLAHALSGAVDCIGAHDIYRDSKAADVDRKRAETHMMVLERMVGLVTDVGRIAPQDDNLCKHVRQVIERILLVIEEDLGDLSPSAELEHRLKAIRSGLGTMPRKALGDGRRRRPLPNESRARDTSDPP